MNAQQPDRPGAPSLDGPHDPEHDPTASYALEPEYVASLTRRVRSSTGRTAEVRTPINGAPLAHVPQSGEQDVQEAFTRARRAQAAWSRTSLEHRSAIMMRLHDLVIDRQEEILDLIVWESGKARQHAFDEPIHIALTARYYARTAHQHLDPRRRLGVVPGLTRVEVNRVPKGVVGIISPWNYPFTMALCDGLPALMAGNAVVAKPDAQTMLSALLGAQLLEEAGFQIVKAGAKLRGLGVGFPFLVTDRAEGHQWYVEVAGTFTTSRPGMRRNDVLWKAIGRAHVLAASDDDARLLVLTSHLPRPRSDGDRALRAVGGRGLFDAVEMFDDDGRARLAHYAEHGSDRPLVGFWTGPEIERHFG